MLHCKVNNIVERRMVRADTLHSLNKGAFYV